jgi:hypothetical protein
MRRDKKLISAITVVFSFKGEGAARNGPATCSALHSKVHPLDEVHLAGSTVRAN